jgi:threonine synthase
MTHVVSLECVLCGRRHDPGAVTYTCPKHDGVSGVLDVVYDDDALAAALSDLDGRVERLWELRDLLPVGDGPLVSLDEGGTPLLSAATLSDRLGVDVRLKDETGNPTGSAKDRGSSIVVTRARQQGRDVVTCASTGNAAASLAGYAARGDRACRIFVPDGIPEGKAVQPLVYGADVLAVEGDYGDAYDLCRAVARRRGWYNRSAALNPYAIEGKRTIGHEIGLEADPLPDWVVCSMGNGCTIAGIWKGLAELHRLGVVDRTPKLLGVQAAGTSPIYDRFHDHSGDGGDTCADSIDVATPHNARRAVRALEDSGGDAVRVDDDAILDAERLLGDAEGVYAEPASASAVAGLREAVARGLVGGDESAVAVVTGTGFKDAASARRIIDDVETVAPSVETVLERY